MKITRIESESITSPEQTFMVEVDNAEINMFLIDHTDFDIVQPGDMA